MKFQNLSVKRLFGRVAMGLVLSMSGITIALFLVTKQTAVLLTGGALLLCALVGIFVLTQAFGKRLSQFTADLCQTLDHMIAGNEAPQRPEDSETQLARIGHRLARLYQIMQENRRRVDEERQELQTLVSDISHQVKTPVSNLKMATDTLLEKPMTEAERTDFIRGIRSQTDKLDFLLTIMSFHASVWLHAARALLRSYGAASGHVGLKSFPSAAPRRLRFGHSSTNNRNGGQYCIRPA